MSPGAGRRRRVARSEALQVEGSPWARRRPMAVGGCPGGEAPRRAGRWRDRGAGLTVRLSGGRCGAGGCCSAEEAGRGPDVAPRGGARPGTRRRGGRPRGGHRRAHAGGGREPATARAPNREGGHRGHLALALDEPDHHSRGRPSRRRPLVCARRAPRARMGAAEERSTLMLDENVLLRTNGTRIETGSGAPVVLAGVGLGGWMNMENFITGYPATESLSSGARCYKALGRGGLRAVLRAAPRRLLRRGGRRAPGLARAELRAAAGQLPALRGRRRRRSS